MPSEVTFRGRVRDVDARRINRYLMEGLFFHQQDNPDLFTILHRNRELFKDFWKDQMGIDIVVKDHVAYRQHDNQGDDPYTGFANTSVQNPARMHFYWQGTSGKLHILIFQRFLYYYESTLRRGEERQFGEHAFLSHHFWVWVNDELDTFFAGRENAPKPHESHKAIRNVLRDLETFGFIREVESRKLTEAERARIGHDYDMEKVIQYHARPGLGAYDPYVLQENPSVFLKAWGWEEGGGGEEE